MESRADVYVIRDLEQIKALADPLRQQILGAFVSQPRTTKQVADHLGVSPTKLYRHVERLERVGLVTLVETRPKRGTVEKYYRAIANRFTLAAESLGGEMGSTIEQSFAQAAAAMQTHLKRAVETETAAQETLLALGSLRLAPSDLLILRERILELTKNLPSDPADRKPFNYLVAIHPTD